MLKARLCELIDSESQQMPFSIHILLPSQIAKRTAGLLQPSVGITTQTITHPHTSRSPPGTRTGRTQWFVLLSDHRCRRSDGRHQGLGHARPGRGQSHPHTPIWPGHRYSPLIANYRCDSQTRHNAALQRPSTHQQ